MGLIEKVKHEEKESISVRMEVGLLSRLNRYAEYLGGTREYVISKAVESALKLADAKDKEWVAFRSQKVRVKEDPNLREDYLASLKMTADDPRRVFVDGDWPSAESPKR